MAIEVPQNEEIAGGGKNGGRKGVGSTIHRGGANRGGVHNKKRHRGGVVNRVRILHNQSRDRAKKEEVESS